jgi:hypothetical protein
MAESVRAPVFRQAQEHRQRKRDDEHHAAVISAINHCTGTGAPAEQ